MMATDLTALIRTAKMDDATDRLMLADAMEEAGRTEEAAVLRGGAETMVGASGAVVVATPLERIRVAHGNAAGGWTGCGWDVYVLASGAVSYFPERGCLAITEDADACDRQAAGWAALAEVDFGPLDGIDTPESCGPSAARAALAGAMGLRDGNRLDDSYSAEGCETLARQWRVGGEHIRDIESSAEAAEEAGAEALRLAEAGDLDAAHDEARRACRLESEYGDCPTWSGFALAIEAAIEDRDEAAEAAQDDTDTDEE